MAVHVFSNPCEHENKKADKYGLKIVYDAAHAMFVNYNGKSILSYGDISATSFHATKFSIRRRRRITRDKKSSDN